MSYQRFLVILGLGMLSITAWGGGGESTATPASAPATIPTNTPTATPSPTATPTATQAPPTPPAGTPLPTATSTTAAAMAAPTATSEPPPSGATIQPSIQNFALQNLTVQVGDTIVWTQQDSTTHTTTSGNRQAQTVSGTAVSSRTARLSASPSPRPEPSPTSVTFTTP